MESQPKAKVFLSSGQRRDANANPTDELSTVEKIEGGLRQLDFEVYVAVEEQTSRDLAHNVFENLEDSEYFVFVDFKREQIGSAEYRGSLFTNQELALAKFLDMQVIAFQEIGIRKQDGILKYIQLNPTRFSDRSELPESIMNEVKRRKWDPHWKNTLVLERDPTESTRALHRWQRTGHWFHVKVRNLHRSKIAGDCAVYLEKLIRLNPTTDQTPDKLVEYKWEGITTPRAPIPPRNFRRFDAFYIFEDQQGTAYMGVNPFIVDSTEFLHRIQGPGLFELTFSIFSNNFKKVSETFLLDLKEDINQTIFYKKDHRPPKLPPSDAGPRGSITSLSSGTSVSSGSEANIGTLTPVLNRDPDQLHQV